MVSKNPDVGQPAVTGRSPARSDLRTTRVNGADLVPDIAGKRSTLGIARTFKYWVGVTPSCPRESIDLAGVNFPKVTERLIPDPMTRGNRMARVPQIGAIVELSEDKLKRMRERLPRLVIRFHNRPGASEEPGTGKNIGDLHEQPSRGHVITIPTQQEIEDARKNRTFANEYTPGPNDVPASRYMFCVLCTDQDKGNRGDVYPEPIETAGIEIPGDINVASLME